MSATPSPLQGRHLSTQRTFTPENTRVGWIGTGVMGRWMCEHIMDAGFKATVYSRTKAKTQPLVDKGAKLAESPFEVASQSDVVFTMLGYPHDVRNVILGSNGVLDGLEKANGAGIVIDMTTSEPSLAREIAQEAQTRKLQSVDAPVSGGDVGAREARLTIMIGGDKELVESLSPLLRPMGPNLNYMGPPGSGQSTKMVNQILISTTMIGMVEGLLYAQRSGLDLMETIQAVGAGAAGSWSINNYGPRIVQRNFEPGFFVDHFVKDMEIALKESKQMGLQLPGLELAIELYHKLQQLGYGKKGTHSLMLALEEMNKGK